jgi:hypothetical protein
MLELEARKIYKLVMLFSMRYLLQLKRVKDGHFFGAAIVSSVCLLATCERDPRLIL